MVGDYPEWQALVITVVGGVVGGLIGGAPYVWQRWRKGEPLFWPKNPQKLMSSDISYFYAGIVMCGIMSVVAFVRGLPLFGAMILVFGALFTVGLVAFKRGWRG